MIHIIGLGGTGCKLASMLGIYSQYGIHEIDSEGMKEINIVRQSSPEAYEKNVPKLDFDEIKEGDELWLILAGSGMISGAALRILEQFKFCKITILYIRPNVKSLSGAARLQERLTYNIFQEYARSGVFERVLLIGNTTMDEIIGKTPISEYHKKINEAVVSTIHMINVFRHSNSILSTKSKGLDSARIETIGIYDVASGTERLCFPLLSPVEKEYFFGINKKRLENDTSLLFDLQMKMSKTANGAKVTYSIFETSYDDDVGYVVAKSNLIQPENLA